MDRTAACIYNGTPLIEVGSSAWYVMSDPYAIKIIPVKVEKIVIDAHGVKYATFDGISTTAVDSDNIRADEDEAWATAYGRAYSRMEKLVKDLESKQFDVSAELKEAKERLGIIHDQLVIKPWTRDVGNMEAITNE